MILASTSIKSSPISIIVTIVVAVFFRTTNVAAVTDNNKTNLNLRSGNDGTGGTLATRTIPVQCPLCGPGTDWDDIVNPSQTFTMTNGITMNCLYLQETVQDVNPNAAYINEAQGCAHARHQAATNGCRCPHQNAFLHNIVTDVTDIHGPCDLCGATAGRVVPSSNFGKTVTTSVGSFNCEGLENAMASGILSSALCPRFIEEAAATCCNAQSTGGAGTLAALNNNNNNNNRNNHHAPSPSMIAYNTAQKPSTIIITTNPETEISSSSSDGGLRPAAVSGSSSSSSSTTTTGPTGSAVAAEDREQRHRSPVDQSTSRNRNHNRDRSASNSNHHLRGGVNSNPLP